MVIVAQLVRALVCGTRGRGFESRLSPLVIKNKAALHHAAFLFYSDGILVIYPIGIREKRIFIYGITELFYGFIAR